MLSTAFGTRFIFGKKQTEYAGSIRIMCWLRFLLRYDKVKIEIVDYA